MSHREAWRLMWKLGGPLAVWIYKLEGTLDLRIAALTSPPGASPLTPGVEGGPVVRWTSGGSPAETGVGGGRVVSSTEPTPGYPGGSDREEMGTSAP